MNKISQIIAGFKNPDTRQLYIAFAAADAMFVIFIVVSLALRAWTAAALLALAYLGIYAIGTHVAKIATLLPNTVQDISDFDEEPEPDEESYENFS